MARIFCKITQFLRHYEYGVAILFSTPRKYLFCLQKIDVIFATAMIDVLPILLPADCCPDSKSVFRCKRQVGIADAQNGLETRADIYNRCRIPSLS